MKEIYILRHANWNFATDHLTEEGRQLCAATKEKVGRFELVISSPSMRAQETAYILSGGNFSVDSRAGTLHLTASQETIVNRLRKDNPLGVIGAILSIPELLEPLNAAGKELVKLTQESEDKISSNQRILIISHDGTIAAAEQVITNQPIEKIAKTYNELEGYIIGDNNQIIRYIKQLG